MSTIDRPRAAERAETPLEQLPPLTVVTDGIPASEHLTAPGPTAAPVAVVAATTRARPTSTDADAVGWAYRLGVVALLLLVLSSFGYGVRSLLEPAPTGARMGLSDKEWSAYRAGERDPGSATAVGAFTPFATTSPFDAG